MAASDDNGRHALSPAAPEAPWYRHRWVWFVIALPATSVLGGIFLVTISVRNADDLVADNWYKEGRGINRSMAAEQQAVSYGIGARFRHHESGTEAQFHATQATFSWPQRLQLTLRHPTLAARDWQQALVASDTSMGLYRFAGKLPAGRWHVRIGSDDVSWQLSTIAQVGNDGELQLGVAAHRSSVDQQ